MVGIPLLSSLAYWCPIRRTAGHHLFQHVCETLCIRPSLNVNSMGDLDTSNSACTLYSSELLLISPNRAMKYVSFCFCPKAFSWRTKKKDICYLTSLFTTDIYCKLQTGRYEEEKLWVCVFLERIEAIKQFLLMLFFDHSCSSADL